MADGPDSNSTPSDDSNQPFNPLSGFPMFGEIAKALQGQGPLNWDAAKQFALLGATKGTAEPNVDPTARIAFADLSHIAAMHVNDVTGASTIFPSPRVVTRSEWAGDTLDDYRPLFTELATSLGQTPAAGSAGTDPMTQMMASLSQMMGPAMMGMSVGSMVGELSQRVFGLHDLPIPRSRDEVVLVASTIDEFATQWDIPVEQMRLWVLTHELSGYWVLSIEYLRDDLAALVRSHVGGFQPDPDALGEQLGGLTAFDPTNPGGADPMAELQRAFSDPEVLLGAVRSEAQEALQPQLDAAVAAVVGYTDWVVDAVAARVIGGDALRIAEAVRRQRTDSSPDDVFVEKLLGIRVGTDQVTRGKSFIQGVVDRVGEDGLARLITASGSMPTPSEIDAPGLWVARVSEGELG